MPLILRPAVSVCGKAASHWGALKTVAGEEPRTWHRRSAVHVRAEEPRLRYDREEVRLHRRKIISGDSLPLARYAMRVEETHGRRYPEPLHPYRNEYERDRDRIVHSRAFRRLENKTQVFTRRFSDHFRNRLTHTLEVAQISRTVAKALGLNTDLVEALALAHDIGHPPFGHAGEAELNRLMRRAGGRFDHNLHALRIVEQFEQKYADFPGLNLTFEVREGIIKHSRDYDPARHPELEEYRLSERPPLEAQLIDVADEIAYNCADLDDGYEAKLLTFEQIRRGVPLFRRQLGAVERKHRNAPEKLLFNEALRRVMDNLVTDLIRATQARVEKLRPLSAEDIRRVPARLARLSPRLQAEDRRIKDFLHKNLYRRREIHAERQKTGLFIAQLFEFFVSNPRSLPQSYYQKTRQEPVHGVVCDYIAGMTDHYLLEQHQRFLRAGSTRRR
jgi:dGTPase